MPGPPSPPPTLPVDELRPAFVEALAAAPIVVSSPTGSGKSSQIPRWCPGRVLVVEPRRVACRSLAQRVAELEGTAVGDRVGYWVRDEKRLSSETRIVFATPGIVLRLLPEALAEGRGLDSLGYETVILDELHERSLEVDLLLALLRRRPPPRWVVMSATLDGERVARHLEGRFLQAEGRQFPVEVRHLPLGALLPQDEGLEERVAKAVEASADLAGDILVFLPGKGEIRACRQRLSGARELEVLELHGGLSLDEQARAFRPSPRRKVILATNVAESSVTVPGVGVVIDSGLVRQTRYFQGRGFLSLVAVAQDSADQRAGRAGRTAPGHCLRLWSEAAQLEERTAPEIHREALAPLVLAAAACGERAEDLPFLDPPREHAVGSARRELAALGALGEEGEITPRGRRLFGLPLDAPLGRLLVEAESREPHSPGILDDMIDMVSVLALDRPRWVARPEREPAGEEPPPVAERCDAVACLRALRRSPEARRQLAPESLEEALAHRRRLRQAFGREGAPPRDRSLDRRRLALAILAADPRSAHVARRRGRRRGWSHGGTEIELGRESLAHDWEELEAMAVLDTRALGPGGRETRVLATCVLPLEIPWMVEAGLGRDRLGEVVMAEGRLVGRIERVYAKKVLEVREEVPQGELARHAVTKSIVAGRLFRDALEEAKERLELAALGREVAARSELPDAWVDWEAVAALHPGGVPSLEEWLLGRLENLGFESGDDLPLLSPEDLLPPDLPPGAQEVLDKELPRRLELPGAVYRVEYDFPRREATLVKVEGSRKEPPSLVFLPRLQGLRIRARHGGRVWTLRGWGGL